jgi:hypothetical protein
MKAVSTIRKQAAATLENPEQIVSGNVGALSQERAANLSSVDALRQKIHHVRKCHKRTPTNPTSMASLVVPKKNCITDDARHPFFWSFVDVIKTRTILVSLYSATTPCW